MVYSAFEQSFFGSHQKETFAPKNVSRIVYVKASGRAARPQTRLRPSACALHGLRLGLEDSRHENLLGKFLKKSSRKISWLRILGQKTFWWGRISLKWGAI